MTTHIVYVSKVTDPQTGKVATVSFDEPCQIIQVPGFDFECEAVHLGTWAQVEGFSLETKRVRVEF